jgi:hypothetical protein
MTATYKEHFTDKEWVSPSTLEGNPSRYRRAI